MPIRLVAGSAARLLYEAEELSADQAAALLARMLSLGTPVIQAAGYFEGFLEGAGQRLIHDAALREAVDAWLSTLEEDAFVANLPLFRRIGAMEAFRCRPASVFSHDLSIWRFRLSAVFHAAGRRRAPRKSSF